MKKVDNDHDKVEAAEHFNDTKKDTKKEQIVKGQVAEQCNDTNKEQHEQREFDESDCASREGEYLATTCSKRKYFVSPSHFKCPRYYCIPWALVCDGKYYCPYGYDEQQSCFNRSCSSLFKVILWLCFPKRNAFLL